MSSIQSYVSKELTHFLGKELKSYDDRYQLLIRILQSGQLTHPPHISNISGNLRVNLKGKISENDLYNPQVVCFCDIPISEIGLHMRKYSSFGLAFQKSFLTKHGANPVFYIAKNSTLWSEPGMDVEENRGDYFDKMTSECCRLLRKLGDLFTKARTVPGVPAEHSRLLDLEQFLNFQVFSYLKAFDATKLDEDPENFYMEREWRIVGNLKFRLVDVSRVVIPRAYAEDFRRDIPKYSGQLTFAEDV